MQVELQQLQPNPLRNFRVDPIDPEHVAKLRESIEEDGFWGGVVCRRANGCIQIAAGHHRIEAAIEAGITVADVFVAEDMDDAAMVRIYARENATQRGNSGTALAGSVASAVRLLAKAAMTEQLSTIVESSRHAEDVTRGHLTSGEGEGLGEPLIHRLLHSVPEIGLRAIREQLANLKASGEYAAIMHDVEVEIAHEREAARQALEQAERAREEARAQEREKRQLREEAEALERQREAERQAATIAARAAREEVEKRRAEEAAQQAEIERQKAEIERQQAEIEAQLAEKRRQEIDAELQTFQAQSRKSEAALHTARQVTEKEDKREKTFDFIGVSEHLKDSHHVALFREQVTGIGYKDYFPVREQAAVAGRLVDEARRVNGGRVTEQFIRDYLWVEVFKPQQQGRAEARAEEEARLHASYVHRARSYQFEIARHFDGIASASHLLEKLRSTWPKGLDFPFVETFPGALQRAKSLIDTLVEGVTRPPEGDGTPVQPVRRLPDRT
jgi:hypothetical protein